VYNTITFFKYNAKKNCENVKMKPHCECCEEKDCMLICATMYYVPKECRCLAYDMAAIVSVSFLETWKVHHPVGLTGPWLL
jgi:hypothetical protein